MVKKAVRFITLLAAVLAVSLLVIVPVNAADIRTGERLTIPAGDVIDDDLYLFGSSITLDGTVNGDVIVFCNRITINGDINGSIIGALEDIQVRGRVRDSVRVAASGVDINSAIGGDLVTAASYVTVTRSGAIGRDMLVAAATIQVNGPVARDIRGSGGTLVIDSSVGGNVDISGNEVKLEPGASIAGNLTYKSEKPAEQAKEATVRGEITHVPLPQQPAPSGQTIGQAIGGLVSAIVGFIVILLLVVAVIKYAAALLTGIILILLARKYIPGLSETLKSKPWPCLGYGALVLFLAPAAIAIAFALVIGTPPGPGRTGLVHTACLPRPYLHRPLYRPMDAQAACGSKFNRQADSSFGPGFICGPPLRRHTFHRLPGQPGGYAAGPGHGHLFPENKASGLTL